MKRITWITIAMFCAAAVAANIPRSLVHGKSEHERRAEVFSAFIALSDTRGSDALPFLTDLASITGEARRMQEARLSHVSPQVLDLLAEKMDVTPQAYLNALRKGHVNDPFDHSGSVVTAPDFDHHGRDGPWYWGVWTHSDGNADAPADGDAFAWCRIWLVIWDDTTWFYSPMGTDVLNTIALNSAPGLMRVPFPQLPKCEANA
ncbi:MAG: hypothetical protein AAF922_15485 [Pseudomonadota bacterium]